METVVRELRQVVRKLSRSPSFTLVAVLTLALGIGANASIFTVVNSVLIRPLPYPDQDHLVVPHFTAPGMGIQEVPYSESAYLINADENRVFEQIGVYRQTALNLTGGTEPERVPAVEATYEVLSILGAVPVLGRLTNKEDDLPGSPEVAVLSYGLWQRRFGGDPSVLGRTVEVNGVSREVVGVLPESFRFLTREAELFFPARFDRGEPDEGSFNYTGIARIRSGVSEAAVVADMERLISLWPERYSGLITQAMLDQIGMAPNVIPLKEQVTGDVSRALWILMAAVGLVLLIACSNVANLFLVRAEGRHREVAIRTAMGASASDLVRYFLAESLTLGIVGGVVGLLLAWAGTHALVSFGPQNLPRLHEIGLDPATLLFTLGTSLLAGLLFGLFPVLKYRRPDMTTGLKEGGRGGSAGKERHRARNTLVVFQMALALVLLVGSGLMLRSFQALRAVDPGFDPRGVLTLRVTLPASTYPTSDSRLAFHDQLLGSIGNLPGVVSAGAADNIPMGGGLSNSGTWFEDFPTLPDQVPDVIETSRVTANYLETLRVGLLEGRTLTPFDARDRADVVVVNRALAHKYWPGQSALGKRLTQDLDLDSGASADTRWKTVVGVVEDVRSLAMDQEPKPALFFPLVEAVDEEESRTPQSMAYVIRSSGEPTALLPAVRQTAWAMDPNLPIADIRTMDAVVRDSMARTAFTMALLGIAALVALLLGTVGIYGVISYVVTQRTREMGIRLALGAEGVAVTGMVLRQGAVLAGIGIAIGLAGAFGLTRLMEALLFGVSATDPLTFLGVPLVLAAVALLASWLPARRAARTDPLEALRAE
jgi:putative ABC transport system permease protein